MRLSLSLSVLSGDCLTLNYPYPLSSAIYKIIQRGDREFAAFLHDKGYGEGNKKFKFFTFSEIQTPFKIRGDRMQLLTGKALVTICFHMPEAAEHFIVGLFMNQQLEIADKKSRVCFLVDRVESIPSLPSTLSAFSSSIITALLQPLSPIVAGRKNERGNYDYLSPEDPAFGVSLQYNLVEKYRAINDLSEDHLAELKELITIRVQLLPTPPQRRLITIKQGTEAETRIRGYTKFQLQVTAPGDMVELALNAGIGLYNAQGIGCVEVVDKIKKPHVWYN
jgi:CRISPR-associated endoribonuclease Cas6